MTYDLKVLEEGCAAYGIALTETQKEQFIRYYELLVEWNKVMNLTGITELQEVLTKHFLDTVIEELKLEGIYTVHGRAEDGARKVEHREQYDLSVSRAVSRLAALCELCMPYVREGGYFISYKSGKAQEELTEASKAISVLGGKVKSAEDFQLYGTDMERTLVVIEKKKKTPKQYPRKAGTPTKEPIL